MIVSILNEKGGVGKTTLSINLARYFHLEGVSTLLVDSDPQGSSRDWHAISNGELLNVVGLDRPTLDRDIEKIRYNYETIVIDGAKDLDNMSMAAIKCSDIVLIPVAPSGLDLWATENLADLVSERITWTDGKLKSAFVINKHEPNTKIGRELRNMLQPYQKSHGIKTFNAFSCKRIAYSDSISEGATIIDKNKKTKAFFEIQSIAKELIEFYDK